MHVKAHGVACPERQAPVNGRMAGIFAFFTYEETYFYSFA
jgi:hypothetical protein